jgi:hypothetical protein
MEDLLFCRADLGKVIEGHEQKMNAEIDRISENKLLNTSVEDLCDYFEHEYRVNPPLIDEGQIQVDYGETKIDVSRRIEYGFYNGGVPGTRVTFFIPFQGDRELFKCRASTFTNNPPRAGVHENELSMVYETAGHDAAQIKCSFTHDLNNLKLHMEWVERDVAGFNAALRQKAKGRIEWRRQKLLKDQGLAANLGFSLRRRDDAAKTYVVPTKRRTIPRTIPPASDAPFAPEPTLGMLEYEHILSVISNMVLVMERSPRAFHGMGEEDLRQHFLVQLNGQYEGKASGETFNFEGKTDILIRDGGKNLFIAECKFWHGPQELSKAIDQLLCYSSWRDTKTALLVFNRDRSLSMVLGKIPEVAKSHPNFKRNMDYKSETGFRFVFGHRDDTNREIIVTVLVFEVPA